MQRDNSREEATIVSEPFRCGSPIQCPISCTITCNKLTVIGPWPIGGISPSATSNANA
jgi:hypothetical protein